LYFPNDVECPINDIIIDNSNKNYIDYKELKLADSKSLYYTNKKISNKIIIDLKANLYNYNLKSNLEKSNEFCLYLDYYDECKKNSNYDINSYTIIDKWNYNSFLFDRLPSSSMINEDLLLFAITYFGFNPSIIKKRKKIQIIISNLLAFKSFYILILICFFFMVCSGCFAFNYKEYNSPFIIFLILILFQIIMYVISIIVRINTIHNFIFKIIYKDEEKDNSHNIEICLYILNLIILSFLFIDLLYLKIKRHFNLEDIITIKRNIYNIPTRNNDKSNDTINTVKLNINEYIIHDSNNKNNKNKEKEKIGSLQLLIINNKNKINNEIKDA